MIGVLWDFLTEEGGAKIEAHDGHPRKHGNRGEVAEVSNCLTKIFVLKFKIKNCEEESCQEYYADNIAQDNLSMEIVEVRNDPIDNEDNK